jgi:hypothetical protein
MRGPAINFAFPLVLRSLRHQLNHGRLIAGERQEELAISTQGALKMATNETPQGQSSIPAPTPSAVAAIPVANPSKETWDDAWMKAQQRVWAYSTDTKFLEGLKAKMNK